VKKIILCILLIGALFCLVSCGNSETNKDSSTAQKELYAMIIMPNGSVISGRCTHKMHTGEWIYVKVNGIDYYMDTWRVVMWEE